MSNNNISTSHGSDPFVNAIEGSLTKSQEAALKKIADAHPEREFEVVRYHVSRARRGSSATHIKVWNAGDERDYVALVGSKECQVYDRKKETAEIATELARRVYRWNAVLENV